ncbi:hypothetical protein GCM10027185_47450 [Spirosoma pulveris]
MDISRPGNAKPVSVVDNGGGIIKGGISCQNLALAVTFATELVKVFGIGGIFRTNETLYYKIIL